MIATELSAVDRAWQLLEAIPDPEIPVVSIRELGILREINQQDGSLEVVITPTYSGCPAMEQIDADVRAALSAHGIAAHVVLKLAPAWTTDWITPEARAKLKAYGIAPPQLAHHANVIRLMPQRSASQVPCPHCGSTDTTETSHFGSTACKALYKCLTCMEPFDYFKPY